MDFSDFRKLRIRIEEDGQVVILELNHGKVNEFGRAELRELEELSQEIRADTAVRALIVCSSKTIGGGKAIFAAGANVTERMNWSNGQVKKHMRWQRSIMVGLRTLPIFSVAVVDGLALGLGTELMVAMDWRIGTPNARFSLPETGIGIVPGALGTAELASLIGVANTLYLGMTGEAVDGLVAQKIGLLNELVSSQEEGLARARVLVSKVIKRSARALATFKDAVLRGLGEPAEARLNREAKAYESLVDSGDAAIGRTHFHSIRKGEAPPWPPRNAE